MTLKRLWALLLMSLLFTGCAFTPYGDAVRHTVKVAGAQAMDAGVENSTWFLCDAISVGALRRWIGGDATLAGAYQTLCTGQVVDLRAFVVEPGVD
jgi:hypothetical protein